MCRTLSTPFGSDVEVARNPPPVVISCLHSSVQARGSMDQPLLNVMHLSLTSGFTLIAQENNTALRNETNRASYYCYFRVSLVAHSVKNLLAVQETTCNAGAPGSMWIGKIPLGKEMSTHSSILAHRIPWTEEPGGLQSIGLQRVRPDSVTNVFTFVTVLYKTVLYLQLS